MSILIVAEHDNVNVTPATLATVSAAVKLGNEITILIMGKNCTSAAEAAAKISDVTKILCADHDVFMHHLAENMAPVITDIVKSDGYKYILFPGTTFGKNIAPRVSALLDTQQISDIISIESNDTFKRPIYGGQAIATVKSMDDIKVITIRATAFDKADTAGGSASVTQVSGGTDSGLSRFVTQELSKSVRPELTSARVVVSGGRGLGSADNFTLIEKLADKLGAAIGASRAAVDAGYVPNDCQVGQTGKVVAPDLYIAVGISGAIQHLAGMKDSKIVVAINKDAEAPIFQIADYGLVADLFTAVPELIEKL